jgi:hypothetical protein
MSWSKACDSPITPWSFCLATLTAPIMAFLSFIEPICKSLGKWGVNYGEIVREFVNGLQNLGRLQLRFEIVSNFNVIFKGFM